jgi:hypothetical protein
MTTPNHELSHADFDNDPPPQPFWTATTVIILGAWAVLLLAVWR